MTIRRPPRACRQTLFGATEPMQGGPGAAARHLRDLGPGGERFPCGGNRVALLAGSASFRQRSRSGERHQLTLPPRPEGGIRCPTRTQKPVCGGAATRFIAASKRYWKDRRRPSLGSRSRLSARPAISVERSREAPLGLAPQHPFVQPTIRAPLRQRQPGGPARNGTSSMPSPSNFLLETCAEYEALRHGRGPGPAGR